VRLEAVGKRYGLARPWVVRDVTMEVPAGRLIRLEGRNGSGKSTLLRVLAGACLPSAGKVSARPSTGYVPERFPPGLAFNPREFLGHLGRVHGMRGPGLEARIDECLERLGAAEYAWAPMRTLSKGMSQKVAVAQALLPRPGLLVLDEAWTGLDEPARGVLDDAVADRLADGAAVVFVDHDPRRLAGLPAERWQVAGGRLLPAAPPATGPQAPAPMRIEVTGVPEAAAAGLPGLRSARAAEGRLIIDVDAACAEAALRRLLADDAARVRSVRPAP
jgi:ABC-2 type transport system ATP-binding protein